MKEKYDCAKFSIYQVSIEIEQVLDVKIVFLVEEINFMTFAANRPDISCAKSVNVEVVKQVSEDQAEFKQAAQDVIGELKERAGKPGQFLNWVGVLQKGQLKEIDRIYAMAESVFGPDKIDDLVVIGIGGSSHTTEAMLNLIDPDFRNGVNVHFYTGVDDNSFNRLVRKINPEKTLFLTVSKSGGTLEPTVAYNSARALMEDKLGAEEAKKHFVAMTDANAEKSKLRQIVNRGDIPVSGFVHDDVGGRFSIFDDATLFTLAYAGMEKQTMEKLLKASIQAQQEFLSDDLDKNKAMQQAIFNVDAVKNGKKRIHFVEMFGDGFNGAHLWEKQLKNESLKARVYTDTNIGPAYLHYNAEADLDPENKDSFYTFVRAENSGDTTFNAVITGVVNAYSDQHPVSKITLKDFSPESVAKYFELKHFETIYTGMLLRKIAGKDCPPDEAMPEVLQPNVEKYKKEVKAALGQ